MSQFCYSAVPQLRTQKTASCAPTTRVVEGGRSKDGLSQNGTTMLVFKPSSTKHWRHVTTTYMYFFDKSQLVHYPYHPPISCKQAGYFFQGWPKDVAVLLLSCSTAEDPKNCKLCPLDIRRLPEISRLLLSAGVGRRVRGGIGITRFN